MHTMTKTALVTGASRGIGRAIAIELASSGFQVAVHYNSNLTAARDTVAGLAGDGHTVLPADLAGPDAAGGLAEAALSWAGGRVDVLVHNAGLYTASPMIGGTVPDWQDAMQRQMQVNFWAGAYLARALTPAMADAGWGRIIQISSRAGLRGEAGFAGYAASKAAQISLIKSLAMELGPVGIGCFAVAPGWTETEMAADALAERGDSIRAEIPLGRVATPADVASLVGFLVTPAADYLSGQTIDVNGASYLR